MKPLQNIYTDILAAKPERIYITGMPGCGKSSLGKQLASAIGWKFIDLDKEIEKLAQQSISQLFEKGEEAFRKIESETLQQTSNNINAVIACGGGTPAFNNNMYLIKKLGISIYLKAEISFLFSRLSQKKQSRPLFQDMESLQLMQKLEELLLIRAPYYSRSDYSIQLPIESLKPFISKPYKAL